MSSTKSGPMNKNQRAHFAKQTINEIIPHILKHNSKAVDAIKKTEVIRYLPNISQKKHSSAPEVSKSSELTSTAPDTKPNVTKISVVKSDTLQAAQSLIKKYPRGIKIGVLNMASVVQPGGGVLRGARAQEESLCLRSTLYVSLASDPTFYPMYQSKAIHTPDVLVFRSEDNQEMKKEDWFWVDVISVAALKHPEVTKEGRYAEEKDRDAMRTKIKLIFQVARQKECKVLVLGALGCGAYGNPVKEVAGLFKKCMAKEEEMEGIEEVVFAIFDEGKNLRTFTEELGEESKQEDSKVVEATTE